jgi:hypothetical protein
VTLEKGGNKGVLLVAVRGLCTLLQDVPHFNFRSNIIATLVPLMAEIDHPEVLGLCDWPLFFPVLIVLFGFVFFAGVNAVLPDGAADLQRRRQL